MASSDEDRERLRLNVEGGEVGLPPGAPPPPSSRIRSFFDHGEALWAAGLSE
jgi:hypothetical protein